jgi:hypothetical protein
MTTDAKEPSRMEQRLAETDRLGIIALRNDLLAGGAFPRTAEHVIELLTSRTLTIYFYADQCRKKEAEVATLTRERDEARKERDAAVAWQTEGYLQLMALYKSTRTAALTQGDA